MRVTLRLIATYRQLLPPGTKGGRVEMELAPGSSVAEVISRFGVPLDDTSVIVLNGLTVPLETPLSEGDTISAFSAIAGGGAAQHEFHEYLDYTNNSRANSSNS